MSLDKDIRAGLALLPTAMDSRAARLILHAINRQENPKRLEQQVGGPARGDYQFERGGGVKGVLTHKASSARASDVCRALGVNPDAESIYQAIGTNPVLAAAMARLLLWTDPKALPQAGDEQGAWDLYLRVWRPGAYQRDPDGLREKWARNYREAYAVVVA